MTAAKAYVVEYPDDLDGRQEVVHAATPSQAKRRSGIDADFIDLRARRAPQFDGLRGDALLRAQLEDGWWMECLGCYEQVRHEADDDNEATPYVIRRGNVFCSASCCLKYLRGKRDERIAKWAALELGVAAWPAAEIEDLFRNTAGEWIYTVKFPGTDHATWTGLSDVDANGNRAEVSP